MLPPIDQKKLSPPAQKLVSPEAPEKLQEMAARGIAPGVRPAELISVLVLLAACGRPLVKHTAQTTLAALPEQILTSALSSDLEPFAVDTLARSYAARLPVVEKLLAMPRIHVETIEHLAKTGTEAVTELIATNEARLLEQPKIIEILYLNKQTRMSTADRLIELATRNQIQLSGIPAWREVSTAIQDELIVEPTEEPTPDDVLFQETQVLSEQLEVAAAGEDTHIETAEGDEVVKEKFLPLYKRVLKMTISQKIRRAMLGSREERMLLVRDHNRLVASAVARSPMIQEDEIALISRNRNVSEEVLRIIGTSPEWLKSYSIKKGLTENPKTPVSIATKLVQHLREADLRQLAKSKNVTVPVQDAARRHLQRRAT